MLKIKEPQREVFYTSSLNIIAFLSMKGFQYESITEFDGRKLALYVKTNMLTIYLEEYRNHKFLQKFITELRNAKTVMSQ